MECSRTCRPKGIRHLECFQVSLRTTSCACCSIATSGKMQSDIAPGRKSVYRKPKGTFYVGQDFPLQIILTGFREEGIGQLHQRFSTSWVKWVEKFRKQNQILTKSIQVLKTCPDAEQNMLVAVKPKESISLMCSELRGQASVGGHAQSIPSSQQIISSSKIGHFDLKSGPLKVVWH